MYYGNAGADRITGGTRNNVFYGGQGFDIFIGGGRTDFYVLQPELIVFQNRNADIVADFSGRFRPGHQGPSRDSEGRARAAIFDNDFIRVYVDDPDSITTLDQLKTALDIDFAVVPRNGRLFTAQWQDSTEHDDLRIIHKGGVVMEFEDFYEDHTEPYFEMFEILHNYENPESAATFNGGVHVIEIDETRGGTPSPEATKLLNLHSLEGADVQIVADGAYADLFEVRKVTEDFAEEGTHELWLKPGAVFHEETLPLYGLTLHFSRASDKFVDAANAPIISPDAQRVEIRVKDIIDGNAPVLFNGKYYHDAGHLSHRYDATTGPRWFDLGGGNDNIQPIDTTDPEHSDVFLAGAGLDIIWGGDANDVLFGGADVDDLFGEDGNDQIYSGSGADNVRGGAGADVILAVLVMIKVQHNLLLVAYS